MYKLTMLLICIILATGGWLLSQSGFDSIQKIRQIERLPQSTIASAIIGEIKISAKVEPSSELLTSEYFKKPSVYFYYRYEVEKQDSDGNNYWSTEYENIKSINFSVKDPSGSIEIKLKQNLGDNLKISIPISEQIVRGDNRYTEWRIEPGDKVFVMGMVEDNTSVQPDVANQPNLKRIGFDQPGQYFPIISKFSEEYEKSNLSLILLLKISGGISLIAFSAFFLNLAFGIHRILLFLVILTFSAVIPLLHLGVSMLYDDIVSGNARLELQAKRSLNAINQELTQYYSKSIDWGEINLLLNERSSLVPSLVKQKVDAIQLNLAFSQEKYNQQLQKFPNNFIAWLYSIKPQSIQGFLSSELNQKLSNQLINVKETHTTGVVPIFVVSLGVILCLGLSWLGFSLIRLKRHIENVPTSKSTGLVFGLSEIKGRVKKVEEIEPLISPLNKEQCYWYYYLQEEKRGSGKNSHWVTIDEQEDYQEFSCRDSYGQVKVFPKDAEIITKHESVITEGKFRYSETVLKLNDKVYILGTAKIDREKGDRLIIRYDSSDSPYLISNYPEQKIMMRKAIKGMLSLTTAFSALIFSSLFLLGIYGSFSPSDYLLVALIAPFYMSFLILVLHYNDLIFLKRRVYRNASNIEVSMQKRFELMPKLEKIIKKYLSHERELLERLTRIRTNNSQHQPIDSDPNGAYSEVLKSGQNLFTKILATVESNPQLKSDQLNINLINKIVDLENEMALLREGYNDAVTYYNTRIEVVPDVFLAKIFKFSSANLFDYPARKYSRIEIDFDN